MSIRDEGVSFSLEVNVGPAYEELRKVETVLYRTSGMLVKFSGSENLRDNIRAMQEIIAWSNRVRLALAAVQAARMAAGDPFAWAIAGLSVAEVGISTYEVTGR